MSDHYVGLMAGTSLDGVDAVLVEITDPTHLSQRAWHYTSFPVELRERLQRYCFAESIPLNILGELDTQLGELFAHCTMALVEKAGISTRQIRAIGSHGQTLHHHPSGPYPYTLQIGDPNRIAELTGITTVADFRRRDVAAGGQGAPLVPAFHQAVFHSLRENRAILNIGGIANLTLLPANPGIHVTGFDTGPGNTLMDYWIHRHLDRHWDEGGTWGRSGRCLDTLLRSLLQDPYFSKPPPKSTGPEYFSASWLQTHLQNHTVSRPEDVQATLARLTAKTIAAQIEQADPPPQRVLVCGGGIHNLWLMELIEDQGGCPVESTGQYGVDPDRVEATAFAWLAYRTLEGHPGNLPAVTGARREIVLGGIFPG